MIEVVLGSRSGAHTLYEHQSRSILVKIRVLRRPPCKHIQPEEDEEKALVNPKRSRTMNKEI
jgi:hypothetical protein